MNECYYCGRTAKTKHPATHRLTCSACWQEMYARRYDVVRWYRWTTAKSKDLRQTIWVRSNN